MRREAIATVAVVMLALLAGCSHFAKQRLRGGDGRLAPCAGPHCVSSQEKDPARKVAPLVYTVAPSVAQSTLVTIIQGMEDARVESNQPGYIHASFAGSLFGYVDDVEFVFASGNRIDVRSSARKGYYDFEVNRKRIESIRAAFDRTQP